MAVRSAKVAVAASSVTSGRSGSTRPHEIDWSISMRPGSGHERWYPGPSAAVSASAVTRPASVAVRTRLLAAGCSEASSRPSPSAGVERWLERTRSGYRRQPRLDIGQQAIGGRDARDQATPRGLANDAGSEGVTTMATTGAFDDTAADGPCRAEHFVTPERTGRSTPSSLYPTSVVGISRSR